MAAGRRRRAAAARGHRRHDGHIARSGDGDAISGYLGEGGVFERSIAAFAVAYADQTERDHAALVKEIDAGRIPVAYA